MHNLIVRTRTEIALYLLNQKRAHLRLLEERFQIAIVINADASIGGQLSYVIEKGEQVHSLEQARTIAAQAPRAVTAPEEDEEPEYEEYGDEEQPHLAPPESVESELDHAQPSAQQTSPGEGPGNDGGRRRKRRRRSRRGAEGREPTEETEPSADGVNSLPRAEENTEGGEPPLSAGSPPLFEAEAEDAGDEARSEAERRRRRRGRRGGRRNRRDRDAEVSGASTESDAIGAADAEPRAGGAVDQSEPAPLSAVSDAEPSAAPAPLGHVDAEMTAPEGAAAEHREGPSAASQGEQFQERPREDASPVRPASPKQPEKPRRRSTVREPAPSTHGESDMTSPMPFPSPSVELPQPIVTNPSEPEPAERPRRSGWWNKRALGKS